MKLNRLEWTDKYGETEDVVINGIDHITVSTELSKSVSDLYGWFGRRAISHIETTKEDGEGWSSIHPFYLTMGYGKPL